MFLFLKADATSFLFRKHQAKVELTSIMSPSGSTITRMGASFNLTGLTLEIKMSSSLVFQVNLRREMWKGKMKPFLFFPQRYL